MPTPESVQQIRFIEGVDRTEDARLTNAGSWFTTENLYGRSPGVLAKRPGSKLIVDGRPATNGPLNDGVNIAGQIRVPANPAYTVTASLLRKGEGNLTAASPGVLKASFKQNLFSSVSSQLKGTRQPVPKINAVVPRTKHLPVQAARSNFLTLQPHRVAGLHRVYMDPGTRFWVVALNFEGGNPDRLAYITGSELLGYELQLIPQEDSSDRPIISTSGADFHFINFRGGDPETEDLKDAKYSHWAIAVNGVDAPIAIKKGESGGIQIAPLQIGPYDSWPLSDSDPQMVACNALAVLGGQVVYGGFRMVDDGAEERWDNYICFGDPGEPQKLASTKGLLSTIRIGESEAEPVTALAVSAVPTGSQGPKGQLYAFTPHKVVVADGKPPVSGNPTGVNFSSTAFPIGTNSPRSVVQTPHGVVFFGSDGQFYLLAGGQPQPIGEAVRKTFAGMTPRQQKQCSAVWDQKEGYYKFSHPDTTAVKGTGSYSVQILGNNRADADVPEVQAWADLRYLAGGQKDLGVRWYLPMTGMKHSCFAVADGAEDRGEIFAGSSIDGSIYQVSLPGYTTDPNPSAPTSSANIYSAGATGLFDLGDAHVDKTITALSFGFGCDRVTGIKTSIIVNADNTALQTQQVFTRTVTPTNAILGSTFTLGTSTLASPDAFELFTERSGSRMRGKTFRFTFEETSGASDLFYSDISFRVIVAQRRI